MKKVLVAYFSSSGKTEEMANYIAEGVRFNGLQAKVMKVSEIKNVDDIAGYDGYIIGSPTFSLDIPAPVKLFLEELKKVNLAENSAVLSALIYMMLLINMPNMHRLLF